MKKAGIQFVARYVSYDGNTKNIDKAEADRLRKGGLDIVIVFETTTGRALGGRDAGAADARSAREQVVRAGGPRDGGVIYFAVDFDAAGSELTTVGEYFKGATSVLGKDRVGAYGGVAVMDYLFQHDLIGYGWETYAWQYRNRARPWHPKAQLQQYSNGHRIDGVSVDYNRAVAADFGQWGFKAPEPKRETAAKKGALPGPAKKPRWFWPAVKEFIRRRNKKS